MREKVKDAGSTKYSEAAKRAGIKSHMARYFVLGTIVYFAVVVSCGKGKDTIHSLEDKGVDGSEST